MGEVQRVHKAYQTRRAVFSSAHRLHSTQLTDAQNLELYGKCNNPNGHGHNYVAEVTLFGTVSPITGMIMNMTDLKQYMKLAIMDPLDHQNLDKDVRFFRERPSTVENVAIFIWESMRTVMEHPHLLYSVKVYETENNIVIYKGELGSNY